MAKICPSERPKELFSGSGMRSARYLLEGALRMLSAGLFVQLLSLREGGADFVWANDANQD